LGSNHSPIEDYATLTVVVPAYVIEITPRYEQLHLDELFSAGALRKVTVGEPGAHATVTGTHGVGVKTPLAADVADAVVGLANDEHIPNVGILVVGMASLILAAVILLAVTPGMETARTAGAAPKLQVIAAVAATSCAIIFSFSVVYAHVSIICKIQNHWQVSLPEC